MAALTLYIYSASNASLRKLSLSYSRSRAIAYTPASSTTGRPLGNGSPGLGDMSPQWTLATAALFK